MKGHLVILFFSVQYSHAVLYHLNDSDYNELPPLFSLDPYERCLHARGGAGVYCSASLQLLEPDHSTQLYNTITEYSSRTETHFNHTQLSYGICLTETCNKYYELNKSADRLQILEACLNDTFWERYKLRVRVSDKSSCHTKDEKTTIDTADILVGVGVAAIAVLNLVGTIRDYYFGTETETFWSCFSITRNWNKLTAPATAHPDSRTGRLQGLYGIKCLLIALVIQCHAMLPLFMNVENVHFMEKSLTITRYRMMAVLSLVVQGFFLMSGMLMSYNLQIEREKAESSWQKVQKDILHRWIRLTPPYVLIVAVTATWLRHWTSFDSWNGVNGPGPLWQPIVMPEVEDCRRYWWQNVIYINNYSDNSICVLQAWYLVADFQLSIVGLLVCALTAGRRRTFLLVLLFALGVISSAAHTYIQDLDGVLIVTPETARNNFIKNATFNHTYKRSHTNLASYVIGLAFGLLVYRCQMAGYKFNLTPFHRFLLLSSVPTMIALLWLCTIFFAEGPRADVITRTLFAALMKPAFGIIYGVLIFGMVFKLENFCRRFLEWSGWTAPATLSYSAYLIHIIIIKITNGTRTTTNQASFIHMLELMISSVVLSFLAAVPLYLLVEAPMRPLVKLLTERGDGGAASPISRANTSTTAGKIAQRNSKSVESLDCTGNVIGKIKLHTKEN